MDTTQKKMMASREFKHSKQPFIPITPNTPASKSRPALTLHPPFKPRIAPANRHITFALPQVHNPPPKYLSTVHDHPYSTRIEMAAEKMTEKNLDPTILTYSDLTLLVGTDQKEYKVHKYTMCNRSDFLQAMCMSDFIKTKNLEIKLPDISSGVMDMLLRYIYTNELDWNAVKKGDIVTLYKAADFLGIDGFSERLFDAVRENMELASGKWI